MFWKFLIQHPSINANAWTEVEEPVGWDNAEITLARDSKWHGIGVEYSLPVKFYGEGYSHIKAVYDNYLIDTFIRCRVQHRTPDDDFQTVFEGRLNLGGAKFIYRDGLAYADVNLEQDGSWQTLMSRMDAKVDLRSLDSPTDDLPAYTFGEYNLKLLPQAIQLRYLSRYAGTGDHAYPTLNIGFPTFPGTPDPRPYTRPNMAFTAPNPVVLYDEFPGAYSMSQFNQFNDVASTAVMSPLFRVSSADPHQIRIRAKFKVRVDTTLATDPRFYFHPRFDYKHDPSDTAIYGTPYYSIQVWVAEDYTDISTVAGVYDFEYEIDESFTTVGLPLADYLWLYFTLADPFGDTYFHERTQIDVALESWECDIRVDDTDEASLCRAILVNEALARTAESLTGRQVTALSDLFGRVGTNASEPLPAPAGVDGDAHNLALAAGLQIRQLAQRADSAGTQVITPLDTSLKALLDNLNACFNIGWALEEVPAGATLPTELDGTTTQVMRVEPKRYFYQHWPVTHTLVAIREYELRPLEKELYTRVEAGYDKFETESLNGLEEFNTRWEFNSDVQRSESTLAIRCSYIAGGYLLEKTRRISPDTDSSVDSPHDNDVFFIATAKSSGTHFDGLPYTPLDTSERAENFVPESALYSPEGNLLDGRRAYNLRLTPQRNLIRWLDMLFAAAKPLSGSPIFRASKIEGNGREYFLLDDGTLDNESAARRYDQAQYASGRNLPFYDTTELSCQYPCSWQDYLRIKANPYSPVQVTESGPADGYWWIRELSYEPAQGMARWKLIKARPNDCLGV